MPDCLIDRANGGSEGPLQDLPTLSTDVLASGPQSPHVHKRLGGAHEHGRKVATEDGVRPRRGRVPVRHVKKI